MIKTIYHGSEKIVENLSMDLVNPIMIMAWAFIVQKF